MKIINKKIGILKGLNLKSINLITRTKYKNKNLQELKLEKHGLKLKIEFTRIKIRKKNKSI